MPERDAPPTDVSADEYFTVEVDRNIGRNVRQAREARGISQTELAKLVSDIGVPGFYQTTIARLESGQRSLKASEALALCRVLEISLEFLAESPQNARYRGERASLKGKVTTFKEALTDLIFWRRHLAADLDKHFPYGADGVSPPEAVLGSGVDPRLYEVIESLLVDSAPHGILSEAYFEETESSRARIYARPVNSQDKSRLEFVFDEMREWLTRDEGRLDELFKASE